MAVSERERHTLHQKLDELMGPDVAGIMMSYLPPVGWADVATKHDLAELEERLTNRFDAMLTREIGGLRDEFRQGLHGEIGSLWSELHREISSLRSELHPEIKSLSDKLDATARTFLVANVGLLLTITGIAFGAAQLT